MKLQTYYRENVISSLEVAEMVGRNHYDVLRDLRKLDSQLAESKIAVSDYFVESTYVDVTGRENKAYKLSKKGCELYATRMTGAKGTLFAVKYIERFNEMENELKLQSLDSYQIDDPIERAKRWIQEQETKLLLERKLELSAPKVEFAEALEDTEGTISVGELAKLISKRGNKIGQNQLFKFLLDNGYVMKDSNKKNIPTQYAINNGWLEMYEGYYSKGAEKKLYNSTRVTVKGQQYFIKKIGGL